MTKDSARSTTEDRSSDRNRGVNQVDALRRRAEVAEQQRDEYLALLRRTQADFENYQKRSRRDLTEEQRYCHAAFARELLPAVDNLRRILNAAKQQGDEGVLVQGTTLMASQLLEVFRRFGITPIEPLGQPFDPHLHEAVLHQPHRGALPNTVVETLEPGYRLHERILRPAKVVVSAATASSP